MENLKYSEILKLNSLLAKKVEAVKPYKINILSNITCNQLKNILTYNLRKSNLNPEIKIGNYDNIIQDSYNCKDEQLVVIHYDIANIVDKYSDFIESFTEEKLDSLFHAILSEIDLVLENLQQIPAVVFNAFTSAGVYSNAIISSKADLLTVKLNEYLYSKKNTNLTVLDINKTIAKVGLSSIFDFRMFFLSKSLYTISFWKEYVFDLSTIIYRFTGILKKAIIFDCDNTLWKGILGEDGMTGIDMSTQSKIGKIYNQVQQIAVWLSNQGVIIGLCSKNNPGDVDKALDEHPDMKLSKENIVIRKINWQDKASNLREIAKELNIGLDSLVFVDDSSFEVNLIKEQIPEILTLQVPTNIHEYPNKLLNLVKKHFYLTGNTADVEKTKQYKIQNLHNQEKNKHQSLEDYLSSINIEITIKENDTTQLARLSQITQKTNQFNLTTQRYTENQINEFLKGENANIISVSVKDKYGDSGLTAIAIIKEKGKHAYIDSFIMSCRIMGRNIEQALMNFLITTYEKKGFDIIESAYYPTIKNKPVINFYENSGFEVLNHNQENKHYRIRLSDYKPFNVNYIKIIN
jgi:FkbH-like protein